MKRAERREVENRSGVDGDPEHSPNLTVFERLELKIFYLLFYFRMHTGGCFN